MGSAAKAQEPTMEEILASIRRIIADDDAAAISEEASTVTKEESVVKAAVETEMNQEDIDAMLADFDAPAVPSPRLKAVKTKAEISVEPEIDEDILELTPSSKVKEPEKVALDDFDAFDEPAPVKPVKKQALEAPALGDVEFRDADFEEPVAAVAQPPAVPQPAVAHTVPSIQALLSDQTNAAVANAFGSLNNTIFSQKPRTMDELVQEMLRPMLKGWLDENLPEIVEGLVRTEIERISRGR